MTEGDAEQNPVGPAPHSKRQEWLAFGALGAIHLSMAVFFVLSRWGLSSPEDKVDAFVFSILRMVFACIIVVAVMKVTVKDLTIPWSGPVFHKLLGVSVFGGVVPVLCFSLGVMLSSATNAAIISVTQPVFTAAIAMIFKVDPFIGRKVAGICVSIAGALAMLNLQNFKLDGATVGNLFLLLQQSALSIYNVLNRKLVSESHLHYGVITAWTLIFGSSGITIISIPFVATPEVWHITWKGWLVIGYATFFAVSVYVGFSWILKHIRPTAFASFITIQPFLSGLLAHFFLGEEFGWQQVMGGILVVIGLAVVISTVSHPPAHSHPPPAAEVDKQDFQIVVAAEEGIATGEGNGEGEDKGEP